MRIGVPKETHQGEHRVATTPEVATLLQKLGYEVAVEAGAGANAKFTDSNYRDAGVTIVDDVKSLYEQCDIILKVRAPETGDDGGPDEVSLLREGQTLISFVQPGQNEKLMERAIQQEHICSGHGFYPAHFPGPENGCLEFDGQYCRLSCCR